MSKKGSPMTELDAARERLEGAVALRSVQLRALGIELGPTVAVRVPLSDLRTILNALHTGGGDE
jgi:hypothetical protein